MKKQRGFTLVELVIVIVILGILAAYAIPKYMNVDREARVAVVKGIGHSVKAAAELVHGVVLVRSSTVPPAQQPNITSLTIFGLYQAGDYVNLVTGEKGIVGDSNAIFVVPNGYPAAAGETGVVDQKTTQGILKALDLSDGFIARSDVLPDNNLPELAGVMAGTYVTLQKVGAPDMKNCCVVYYNKNRSAVSGDLLGPTKNPRYGVVVELSGC